MMHFLYIHKPQFYIVVIVVCGIIAVLLPPKEQRKEAFFSYITSIIFIPVLAYAIFGIFLLKEGRTFPELPVFQLGAIIVSILIGIYLFVSWKNKRINILLIGTGSWGWRTRKEDPFMYYFTFLSWGILLVTLILITCFIFGFS